MTFEEYVRQEFRGEEVQIIGFAVFVSIKDGFSLYFPRDIDHRWSKGFYCACMNIQEFVYGENVVLLKIKEEKSFWMPIFLIKTFFYTLEKFSEPKEYLKQIPKIYFEGISEAVIKNEFAFWSVASSHVIIDNRNYDIRFCFDDKTTSIKEFESIETVPIKDKFKAKEMGREAIYDAYSGKIIFGGEGSSIEEIKEEEYPRYDEKFIAYFLKDESNILGIYVSHMNPCSTSDGIYRYKIFLSEPAKEVKFIRRNSTNNDEKMSEIWGVKYNDDRKEIIVQTVKRGTPEHVFVTCTTVLNEADFIF